MKYIAILLLVLTFSVAPVIAEGKPPKVDIQRMKAKAEQGDAKAQLLLALMYDTGNGVPQDNRKSFEWCKKSAEHGFAEAQLLLGLMYDVGNGVPKSNKKAVKWCRKAANQGYAEAQLVLGGMHSNGLGVIQNDVLAYMWFNLAAIGGNKGAIKNLEILASKMTPEQIAKAQKLTRNWNEEE